MGDTVIEAEEPDWKKIFSDSVKLLDRTHDLRVLIFMIRAGLRQGGFATFSEVLTVLSGWVESQWDYVYPQLDPDDDNDPTERVNVIMTLCDFDAMLRPVVLTPIITSNALGKFSLKNIRDAQEGGEPNLATVEAAFTDCGPEQLQQTSDYISTSIEMLNAIENNITQQVGVSNAPNLSDLLKILKEIASVLSNYGASDSDDSLVEGNEEGELSSGVAASGGRKSQPQGVGTISSSQDVTKALEKIIEYYQKHEPSSPVPMLLERAKGLVNMDFMSIIKNLASDGESQVMNIRGPVEGEDEY